MSSANDCWCDVGVLSDDSKVIRAHYSGNYAHVTVISIKTSNCLTQPRPHGVWATLTRRSLTLVIDNLHISKWVHLRTSLRQSCPGGDCVSYGHWRRPGGRGWSRVHPRKLLKRTQYWILWLGPLWTIYFRNYNLIILLCFTTSWVTFCCIKGTRHALCK